ncbi:MAG TPA: hypothetical protein VJ804_14465 [Acidimicrobiales bacterium]|nr:hypothetical protein [Acidimicrobiales bacterium]
MQQMQHIQQVLREEAPQASVRLEGVRRHVDWAWLAVGLALVAFWTLLVWVLAGT